VRKFSHPFFIDPQTYDGHERLERFIAHLNQKRRGRMNNGTKSQAKPKRAVTIWGFVVLLGIMFNLAWSESATAGNSNDLNGDGKADIVWRNSKNGSTAIWLLNEAAIASGGFPGGVPLAWQIARASATSLLLVCTHGLTYCGAIRHTSCPNFVSSRAQSCAPPHASMPTRAGGEWPTT
jgi:FG-GAP repeat protein